MCVCADGTGECSMLGDRSSGVMVMKWSIIINIIIPLHITGLVGCPLCVGICWHMLALLYSHHQHDSA